MDWKLRIVGSGSKPASQFLPNPLNYRLHPQAQRDAVRGSLTELGWIQNVIENVRTGNLIDGHERVMSALQNGDTEVPYIQVDLSPEEEKLALAVLDPIGAMAETDDKILAELLKEVETGDAGLQALLDEMATESGIVPSVEEEISVTDIKEQFQILVTCKDESQQTELLGRFTEEGIECRSLVS